MLDVSSSPTCPNCQKPVPVDAQFRPHCGASLQAGTPVTPVPGTGLEQLGRDSQLQTHWGRRVAAVIIDGILVGLTLAVLSSILLLPLALRGLDLDRPDLLFPPFGAFFAFPLGILFLLYFAFAESWYGVTVGKRLLGLRVETVAGQRIGLDKALLRNLSKLHWILLLLDVLVGLGTTGDPRQKFSDRFAGTRVVSTT